MVIKGEKVPAFSATTLALPEPQSDNSHIIIENTRAHFARPRAEVEKGDTGFNCSPYHLTPKQPPQAQAKKWPSTAQTAPVAAQTTEPNRPRIITDAVSQPLADTSSAPKRRRTRSRSRKKNPDAPNDSSQRPATTNDSNAAELKLR